MELTPDILKRCWKKIEKILSSDEFLTLQDLIENSPEEGDKILNVLLKEALSKIDEEERFLQTITDEERFALRFPDLPMPDIYDILEDPFYLGNSTRFTFPKIKEDLIDIFKPKTPIRKVLMHGSLGWGKTTSLSLIQSIQVIFIAMFKNPQLVFGIDIDSTIIYVLLSKDEDQAEDVGFKKLINQLTRSPFIQKYYRYNNKVKDKLIFPGNIEVLAGGATLKEQLGKDVIGGGIDEANFMQFVQSSKRKIAGGGSYDQAHILYSNLKHRITTRFKATINEDFFKSRLALASSAQFPGDFTVRQMNIAKASKDKTVKIMSYAHWETRKEFWQGFTECFHVEYGGKDRPRIIEESDPSKIVTDGKLLKVPISYLGDFKGEEDLELALRNYGGISILGNNKYFKRANLIKESFEKIPKEFHFYSKHKTTLTDSDDYIMPHTIINPNADRFIHLDLSKNKLNTGFCMGHIAGFVIPNRKGENKKVETLSSNVRAYPVFRTDLMLCVTYEDGGEIDYLALTDFIFSLRDFGYKIRAVSADQYQSIQMQQTFERSGIETRAISLDQNISFWKNVKEAMYDGRLEGYMLEWEDNDKNNPEMVSIYQEFSELIKTDKKITNLNGRTKDVADAVTGCYNLALQFLDYIQTDIMVPNVGSNLDFVNSQSDPLNDTSWLFPEYNKKGKVPPVIYRPPSSPWSF